MIVFFISAFLLKCSSCGLVSTLKKLHLYALWLIFLYKMPAKHGAEVLCHVSKHEKSAMCITEKIHVR